MNFFFSHALVAAVVAASSALVCRAVRRREMAAMSRAAEARESELLRHLRRRDRLIRGFSHDLKNPLGAADGYAALLELDAIENDEERIRALASIRRCLQTAGEITGNLLNLARAEEGELPIHTDHVRTRTIVVGAEVMFR
jgi:signal transduction histidine kinase